MILVTGAAGKTGRAVIRALLQRGTMARALVRRVEQVAPVRELGAQSVIIGDMCRPATWTEAMQDVRAVYHICPNMSPDEEIIGKLALDAARQASRPHFVYHSVLHPQTESMPHHWLKLRVEELILQSGLRFTILQPAAYMQNVIAGWEASNIQGTYAVPYSLDTRLGMVDLEDVAEAAAIVLTQSGHEGATYELAGPEVFTQVEVVAILSQQLERPVRAEVVALASWERQARAAGLGDYQVETLSSMFRYYERFGFWGNPRVLQWLLERPPTSFAAFVAREARGRS
jgi:uncharacterized protein YbjT (DUF2867 family)